MNPQPDPSQTPPGGIEIAPGVVVPESVLRFSYARSSGPGGQNVNKLSTKVRLHVSIADLAARIGPGAAGRLQDVAGVARLTDAGDLVLASDSSRSQHANRQECLDRLRQLLVQALRPPRVRRRTRPSGASRQRRLDAKKSRGQIKRQRGRPPEA